MNQLQKGGTATIKRYAQYDTGIGMIMMKQVPEGEFVLFADHQTALESLGEKVKDLLEIFDTIDWLPSDAESALRELEDAVNIGDGN